MNINIKSSKIQKYTVGNFLKKQTICFLLSIISVVALAQAPLVSKKQIGMFINSTTCVVLEGNINPYNVIITNAIEKYWNITPYEFIDSKEFEKRRFDTQYSFLVLMTNEYDNDPEGVGYNYLGLVLGGQATDLTQMPELCNIPIQYAHNNNLNYEYAMPAIVKFIQIHTKNLERRRFCIYLRGLRYYNSSDFKHKQLLMNKDKMAPNVSTIQKINKVYPYFVKLLSSSAIKEEINSSPNNSLFHFHVGPNQNKTAGKCFEMIFDKHGNLYYYSKRRVTNKKPDGFNAKNFRRIR